MTGHPTLSGGLFACGPLITRASPHMPRPVNDIIASPLRAHQLDRAADIFRRAMLTVPCFDPLLHSPEEDKAFWRDHVYRDCQIIGSFRDGQLLGQVAISMGWIHQLHVDPAYHGQGVGAGLVNVVKAHFDDIQLWTLQANLGARRFYERHGFIAVEFTDGSRNEEQAPDVRYRWVR